MMTKPLYIETDASEVGLGVALLHIRSNTNCHRDEVLDNSIPRPITVASKSLTGAEKKRSNIEREVLGILYGLEKFHHYCSAREVSIITDHKTTHCHFQKRCSYIITEATANPTKNTSIQGENHTQAWTRPIHGRLAVQM